MIQYLLDLAYNIFSNIDNLISSRIMVSFFSSGPVSSVYYYSFQKATGSINNI
jgi:expansin (peptidoglycan-binding protein)